MKETVINRQPPRRALPGSIAAGADDLSVHFEGLANPTRLAVVELLAQTQEVRVTELATLCRVSQPRMSWHLRILKKARVIRMRREGREVFCSLDRESIAAQQQRFSEVIAGRRKSAVGTAAVLSQTVTEEKL